MSCEKPNNPSLMSLDVYQPGPHRSKHFVSLHLGYSASSTHQLPSVHTGAVFQPSLDLTPSPPVSFQMYDLSNPGLNRHSYPGCPQVESVCSGTDLTSRCGEHGRCVGSMTQPACECDPGWSGRSRICLSSRYVYDRAYADHRAPPGGPIICSPNRRTEEEEGRALGFRGFMGRGWGFRTRGWGGVGRRRGG